MDKRRYRNFIIQQQNHIRLRSLANGTKIKMQFISFSQEKKIKKPTEIDILLISRDDIGVSMPFELYDKSKNILKAHRGSWDHDNKIWVFDSSEEENLMNAFAQNFPELTINRIPQLAYRAQTEIKNQLEIKKNKKDVIKSIKYSEQQKFINPQYLHFYDKLYPFQKQSIKFGIQHHGRILLGDQMGVGKTIQSLALAYIYKKQWPMLIICPSFLKFNWQDQILRWYKDIKEYEIQILLKGGSSIKQKTKILIISYELATKQIDLLYKFNVVIADQAHYLKGLDSKRSQALVPFLKQRKRVILLTGTPAFAKPKQLYNLLSIIRPDIFFNFKEFGIRYCDPKKSPWSNTIEYDGSKNHSQLYYLIKNRIMIRRLKKQVLTDLPEKQRQKVLIETDGKISKQINSIITNLALSDEIMTDEDDSFIKAYMLTAKAKLNGVKLYINEMIENDVKILVFAHHQMMLDQLQNGFKQKKVAYIRIDGNVSSQQRHSRVKDFQQKENIKAALLSITAAGVGLTLTASSTVIFAELHYTPGMMIQAEDRAHRIGQPSSVNCHYLIGECTLDDILYKKIQYKFSNVSKMIDGGSSSLEVEKVEKGQKGKISKNNFKYSKQQKKEVKQVGYRRLSDYFIKKSVSQNTTITNQSQDIRTDLQLPKSGTKTTLMSIPQDIDDFSEDNIEQDQQLLFLLDMKKIYEQQEQQMKKRSKKIIQ